MRNIVGLSLIDGFALLAVVAVLPAAVGGPRKGGRWWWVVAAAGVLASLLLEPGPLAGLLVVPWIAVAAFTLTGSLPALPWLDGWRPRLDLVDRPLAALYALVAGGAMVMSRLGVELLGVTEPLVELTAIHYTYAGSAALVLAGAALAGAGPRGRRAGLAAVSFTAVAPPVVAAGFVSRLAWLQVGGAVLLTVGVWLTASLHVAAATRREHPPLARALLAVSGLAVWAPMVLAVAWAAGQHWGVPALSIPDMARTHGTANAVGFVLCGLAGRHLAGRSISRIPSPRPPQRAPAPGPGPTGG